MTAYGIDFGTTNSIAAVCSDGRTRPLVDPATQGPTPSVVWYSGDGVVVGKEAKRHRISAEHAGTTCFRSIKRQLGQDREMAVLGRTRPAWAVASEIFQFLRQQARSAHGEDIGQAVVTVPVTFDGRARADVRAAAQSAGIHVQSFIHEPFAALVGYLARESGHDLRSAGRRTVLVFDWGGGTLDVTVVRVRDGKVWELSADGLRDRAGDRFDNLLRDHSIERFGDLHSIGSGSINLAPATEDRLIETCEARKIDLSTIDTTKVTQSDLLNEGTMAYDLDVPISRADFTQLIEDDVDRAVACAQSALRNAGIHAEEVTEALLVGGSCNIPHVADSLRHIFGVRTIKAPASDTIIAEGAALIAEKGWLPYLVRPLLVRLADGGHLPVLAEGTILTTSTVQRELSFYCTDGRDGEARLVVCEQPDPSSDECVTKQVLPIPVSSDLPRPYNHERVTVSFAIDENGVLNIQGRGATQDPSRSATSSIYDLHFGLRVGGD
jgi:molecular chaperone DnaK